MRSHHGPLRYLLTFVVSGLACDPQGSGGTCLSAADCGADETCYEGACHARCNDSSDCLDGSYECTTGVCVAVAGATCKQDEECVEPPDCTTLAGARCSEGHCSYPEIPDCVPTKGVDEICTADGQCFSGFCECTGQDCALRRCAPAFCFCGFDADPSLNNGCDGALDDVSDPDDCDQDASCIGSLCKKDDEQSCGANVECRNVCAAGTCLPQQSAGGVCDQNADCATGYCDLSAAGETQRCCESAGAGLVAGSGGNECCDIDGDCGTGNFCRASTFQCVTGAEGGDCDAGDCDAPLVCINDSCAMVGQPCTDGSTCASGACRTDYDGAGMFCALDAASCVAAGSAATAEPVTDGSVVCYGDDSYRCSSGSWTVDPCTTPPAQCLSPAGACNPVSGSCEYDIDEDADCDDGNGCTGNDVCDALGACVGTYSCVSPLKAVQSGTASLLTTATVETVEITPVDLAKSFLVFSRRVGDTNASWISVSGQLEDSDTIRFERTAGASAALAVNIVWYVVELASGARVQRGTAVLPMVSSSDPQTVTVPLAPSVDLTHAFPLISSRNEGMTLEGSDLHRATLFDASTLLIERLSTAAAAAVEWQVVEIDSAQVHTGLTTLGGSATVSDFELTDAVDVEKTWVVFSYDIGVFPDLTVNQVGAFLSSPTNLRLIRQAANGVVQARWYAVEFLDQTLVRHQSPTLAAAVGLETYTPTGVSKEDTIAVGASTVTGGGSNNPGKAWCTYGVLPTGSVEVRRTRTDAGVTPYYSVITFSGDVE